MNVVMRIFWVSFMALGIFLNIFTTEDIHHKNEYMLWAIFCLLMATLFHKKEKDEP